MIQFRRMKNFFGMYSSDVVEIGAKPKRQMRMYVETFIHEVAHHIDSEDDYSQALSEERRKKGSHIGHLEAQRNNAEYFARGFERFYSPDVGDKKKLRKKNPKLYKTIQKLHRQYSAK
jgi:Mlc titration factor MtfA (ptsG expression regulator)